MSVWTVNSTVNSIMLLGCLACSGFVLGFPTPAFAQTCSQTLSAGANLSSALSLASPGSTICLNSGSYGSVSLSNVTKNPRVTVRSVIGQGATFNLSTTNGANGFTFNSVTLTEWNLSGSSTRNITVQNTRFTGQADLSLCGVVNANILIDGSTFINTEVGDNAPEGRLHIAQPACRGSSPVGVTVTNSLFENNLSGAGESDGIQVGANGAVIGPGNTFRGIRQANFSRHIDAIQLYGQSNTTITGNYFVNNTAHLGAYDGGDTETVTNNVFTSGIVSLKGHRNDVVTHNTFAGTSVIIDNKPEDPQTSGLLLRDNLFRGSSPSIGNGCASCTITHNMFSSGGTGTNNIIGSPTFIGGTTPSTWVGYRLAVGSIGKGAATDGQDMGANSFGDGTITPPPPPPVPAAPTNVRVVR
jgi:hypothetical protein